MSVCGTRRREKSPQSARSQSVSALEPRLTSSSLHLRFRVRPFHTKAERCCSPCFYSGISALLVRKNPGCVSKARRRRGRVTALREQRGAAWTRRRRAASGARPQRSEPGRGGRGGQRRDESGEPPTAGRKCRDVSTEDTEQVSTSLSRRTVSQVCDWLISHCNRDTRGSRLQDHPH